MKLFALSVVAVVVVLFTGQLVQFAALVVLAGIARTRIQ